MLGKTISHYKIVEKLGNGGMGMVYKANDQRLKRPVTLKFIPQCASKSSQDNINFKNEALAISALNHPNIVTIHDIGEYNQQFYIVMEYIVGKTLRTMLESGPLSVSDSVNISLYISKSIQIAHRNKIFHLDIKPENIMINKQGTIKILDFGLANYKQTDIKISKNIVAGTIEYMSPERFQGEYGDSQSDIFSIGIIMYEMLTGTYPFKDQHQAAIIYNILNSDPIPISTINPQIPTKLSHAVEKAIEKEKNKRYKKVDDLITDLNEVIADMKDVDQFTDDKKQISSIAVLPFLTNGKNSKYKYIAEGIAEDLIIKLSQIQKLRVTSRLMSFKYKDVTDNMVTIGKELGVKSILKGSIQKSGDNLKINVQLIDTKKGHVLWSEKFDAKFKNILNIRETIASNIIQSLRIVITGHEINRLEKSYTDKSDAYDYYLRGRSYFHQMRRVGIESAIKMYLKAIQIDPNYTLAYAGLADCYSFLHLYWESNQEIAEKAINAGIMAVKLDNNLAEAHVAYGLANSIIDDYKKSEDAFQNALKLNPLLFEAYYFNARIKFAQGDINSAMFLYEKSCQVQPEDYQPFYFLATIYKSIGREQDSIKIFKKCIINAENQLHINPTNVRALYMGGAALVHIGESDRGIDWVEQALIMDPNEPATYYNSACTYATVGNIEKGLYYLEKAVEAGFARKDWMQYDSDLDPLRKNPKFKVILKKLN